jgi:hypothetical protein
VRDYDYEYRQGGPADPFGHHSLIEKRLDKYGGKDHLPAFTTTVCTFHTLHFSIDETTH